MQSLKDTLIDHYRVGDRIAKGGMSEIYLAQDIDTQEAVALKLVHSSNFDYCERFQREVQTIATLNHPHIVPSLAYGTHESWCYLVTPYFADGTLDKQLSGGPLTFQEVGDLLEQLGGALQFAHDHGILHRDIKPSNVLMQHKGYAYLADFGLARQIESQSGITASDYLIGTAEYMAPELAEEKASVRSDIYALGVLLYQLLTGRVPFKGQTPISTFLKQMSEEAIPPSAFNPAIPPVIEQVILQALEKKPGERFASAQDFVNAYQAALHFTEPPVVTLIEKHTSALIHPSRSSTSITTIEHAQTNASGFAHKPILPLLAATMILFLSLLVGFTFYSSTLGDNDKASKLSRVDVVTITPPITAKMLNTLSLKGEASVSHQHQPKQKPVSTAHPAQFLDSDQSQNNQYNKDQSQNNQSQNNQYNKDQSQNNQPQNKPGYQQGNGHTGKAQHNGFKNH